MLEQELIPKLVVTVIVLLALIGGYKLWEHYTRMARRTAMPGTTPAHGTAPTTTRSWHSSITEFLDRTFDGGTVAIIAALLFLEYTLWQYVPAAAPMFEGWALMHIAIYVVAILIISKLEASTTGRRYFLGMSAMIVSLAIIGLSHIDWRSYLPNSNSAPASVQTWNASAGSRCASAYPVAATPLLGTWSNPGSCDLTSTITRGTAKFYYPSGVRVVRAGQQREQFTPEPPLKVEPLGYVEWVHRTCGPGKAVPGTWDCRG
jgi:hypothetical protein